ncbi:MAG: VOC family protein [Alphaproteobacteria bacterium]
MAHDGQTPGPGEIFLDHVAWFVPDIARAEAAFTNLGFTLTPFVAQHNADPGGGPPIPAGTGNHCAMLETGYMEILTAIPGMETKLADQLRTGVARYTGLHLIALTTDDAEATRARLQEAGFEPGETVHLRRPVEAADGGEAEVSFSVIRVAPKTMPEGRIQMLSQNTPELCWQDRFITRENGVTGLSGMLLCVNDPLEAADRFARYAGRQAAGSGEYRFVQLDRGRLGFATPDRCRKLLPDVGIPCTPFMAAIGLAARDPLDTRRYLTDHGFNSAMDSEGLLYISAMDSMGATLVIHGDDIEWPPAGL